MCNCTKKEGFRLALFQAKAFEDKSGKKAAIFSINNTISFTDLDNISKVEGICCYYTTDSQEHEILANIEVQAEVVKPKRKRKKKTDVDVSDVDFTE